MPREPSHDDAGVDTREGAALMARIALISTSDTDLLPARASGADYLLANPTRPGHTDMADAIEAADRILEAARASGA